MVPPTKRRKLCSQHEDDCNQQQPDMADASSGTVDNDPQIQRYFPSLPPPRGLHRVDEVHVMIQQRSVDDGALSDLLQSSDKTVDDTTSLGNAILDVDVTGVADLLNATSVVANLTSDILSTSTTTHSSSTTQVTSPPFSATYLNSTSSTFVSPLLSSTLTFNSTGFNRTSTSTSNNTAAIFLASLSNGATATLPESSNIYTTTLANGEVFVVPASQNAAAGLTTATAVVTDTPHDTNGPVVVTAVSTLDFTTSSTSSPARGATYSAGSASSSNSADASSPPTAEIAGGVVGGAAGVAVVLLVAIILLRWYRRRGRSGGNVLQATSFLNPDSQPEMSSPSGPGMAERAGLRPLVAAVPGFFRHQNRSLTNTASSTTAVNSTVPGSSERGFTRVSGRKLPSAFSPGMTDQSYRQVQPHFPATFLEPATPDSESANPFADESDESLPVAIAPAPIRPGHNERMVMSRGPQRRPTIHQPRPHTPTTPETESANPFEWDPATPPPMPERADIWYAHRRGMSGGAAPEGMI